MSTPDILYLLSPLLLALAAIFFLQHRNKLAEGCHVNRLLRVLASIDQPMEQACIRSTGAEARSDSKAAPTHPAHDACNQSGAAGDENHQGERNSSSPGVRSC